MFSNKEKNKYIGYDVFTRGGLHLGVVISVENYFPQRSLKKIYVRKKFFGVLFGKTLIIDRSQIIGIYNKKIVVEDLVSKINPKSIIYEAETV
jgi:hypothetical protein